MRRALLVAALLLCAARAAVAAPAAPAAPAPAVGGKVYRARIDAGGAAVALFRYASVGPASGTPLLILPELGCDHTWYEALAKGLQQRGLDVFVLEWRGTGQGSAPPRPIDGLDALFLLDAPAALDAVRAATGAGRVQLLGHGAGGAAAVFLAASERGGQVASLALAAVPARWEVPNEAVRRLFAAADARPGRLVGPVQLAAWAESPSPLAPPAPPASQRGAPLFAPAAEERDLFELLFLHGTRLTRAREAELRAGLGRVSPRLLHDVRLWMERGDLRLANGSALSQALGLLQQPLLVIAGLRDNLVHPEHALATRRLAPQAPQSELVVQRLEGFSEDAGHALLQAPWAPQELGERLSGFFAEHR